MMRLMITFCLQVLNIETNAEFILSAPGGQVYAMVVANGMLLVGVHVSNLPLNFDFDLYKFNSYRFIFHHVQCSM